jgi:hypothetical protein
MSDEKLDISLDDVEDVREFTNKLMEYFHQTFKDQDKKIIQSCIISGFSKLVLQYSDGFSEVLLQKLAFDTLLTRFLISSIQDMEEEQEND